MFSDDILIFAGTKDELVERASIVLERLRKHNITVNPEKVKMGLTTLQLLQLQAQSDHNPPNSQQDGCDHTWSCSDS